jgi:hypothetical protein
MQSWMKMVLLLWPTMVAMPQSNNGRKQAVKHNIHDTCEVFFCMDQYTTKPLTRSFVMFDVERSSNMKWLMTYQAFFFSSAFSASRRMDGNEFPEEALYGCLLTCSGYMHCKQGPKSEFHARFRNVKRWSKGFETVQRYIVPDGELLGRRGGVDEERNDSCVFDLYDIPYSLYKCKIDSGSTWIWNYEFVNCDGAWRFSSSRAIVATVRGRQFLGRKILETSIVTLLELDRDCDFSFFSLQIV